MMSPNEIEGDADIDAAFPYLKKTLLKKTLDHRR